MLKQTMNIKGFRLLSWVTAANVSIACTFSLVGLFMPERLLSSVMPATQASSLFAGYAAARAVPLALLVFVAIYKRSAHALVAFGALAGLIQLGDFVIGLLLGDLIKSLGPFVIAILQFYSLYVFLRSLGKTLRKE